MSAAVEADKSLTGDSDERRKAARQHFHKVTMATTMMIITAGLIVADWLYVGLDMFFAGIILVLSVWSLVEYYRLCESRGMSPFARFGTFSGGMLLVLTWITMPGTISWFADRLSWSEQFTTRLSSILEPHLVELGVVVAVFGSLWLQATKPDNDRTFESISSTTFGVLYVWFTASFLIRIRHLGAGGMLGGEDWNSVGSGLLLASIAVSKLADVGGYLVGRKFGKHRLIPRISPKKSYEGLVGGLALSIAAAFIFRHYGILPFDRAWMVLVFALLVGGMGVLGDLAESLLKRGSGIKDSGDYIPGFGGILDVVDSVLLSAPVAYFLSVLLLRI